MADGWNVLVEAATVASGVAAAAALFMTLLQEKRGKEKDERDIANRVIAWAVREGPSSDMGGVIIANDSALALVDVDVRTHEWDDNTEEFVKDGFPGQRFSLIPPGTYYLQQVPPAERTTKAASPWSVPMPVATDGGKFEVTPPPSGTSIGVEDAEPTEALPITLIPVTRKSERKRVALLRFTLAGTTWQRTNNTELARSHGTTEGDTEFKASEQRPQETGVRRTQNHSKHTDVIAFYRGFYTFLTGTQPAGTGPSSAEPRADHRDIIRQVELTGGQQAVKLEMVSDEVEEFCYFAGNNKGYVAAAFKLQLTKDRQRGISDANGKTFKREVSTVPSDPAGRNAFYAEIVEAIRKNLAVGPQR